MLHEEYFREEREVGDALVLLVAWRTHAPYVGDYAVVVCEVRSGEDEGRPRRTHVSFELSRTGSLADLVRIGDEAERLFEKAKLTIPP